MTANPTLNRRILVVFHSMGLSCIGSAIFLQILAFYSILNYGYFRAVETNVTILLCEIGLAVFGLIYLIYLYQQKIQSIK